MSGFLRVCGEFVTTSFAGLSAILLWQQYLFIRSPLLLAAGIATVFITIVFACETAMLIRAELNRKGSRHGK